jgi:hypothetical protein
VICVCKNFDTDIPERVIRINDTSADILHLIEGGLDEDAVVNKMKEMYQGNEEAITIDTCDFIKQLKDLKIID